MKRERIGRVICCVLAGLTPLLLLAALPASAEQTGSDLPQPASQVVAASTLITYYSSVDGAALDYVEYLPAGYNPAVAYPVVILLHGAGGNVYQYDTPEWHTTADTHGYILAMAHARTLPGYGASRLSFYMNGALVPAEQSCAIWTAFWHALLRRVVKRSNSLTPFLKRDGRTPLLGTGSP